MMKNSRPSIRFMGFTEDWEQRKLGDVITEFKETVDSDCALPILTSSKTEGVVLQEDHFGSKQRHDITGYNILPRNYCTYRNRSDGVDFTFNVNKCCDKGIISKFYPVFTGNNSDVFFISLVLNNSEEVVREIGYTCTGTGQKVLSFLELQKMRIRVPSFEEQKKIAGFFEQMDDLITLHQRKLEMLQKYKKSMLQKMFPRDGARVPELRFEGFTDDWEQRKCEEILKSGKGSMKIGPFGSALKKEFYTETGVKVYAQENIFQEDFTIGNYYISQDRYESLKSCELEPGDLVISMMGTVGACAIFPDDAEPGIMNSHLLRLQLGADIYPEYIHQLLRDSDVIKKQIDRLSVGSIMTGLSSSVVQKLVFPVPSYEEQKKIAELLKTLDNTLTLHQRKLEELKKMKKSLLQKMFI